MSGLNPAQIRNAAMSFPFTRDFNHLKNFPRHWLKRFSFSDPNVKASKPKDRIKYWNIVPGDQVRVVGDAQDKILEVSKINRITNRVYLKGSAKGTAREGASGIINVHYSRCQLFIGNHEFPPKGPSNEPRVVPVFATRLGTSAPHWQPMGHRYEWDRFAAATSPSLPNRDKDAPRVRIPWPKPADPPQNTPTVYDTAAEAVTAVTYKPLVLTPDVVAPSPKTDPENTYIQSLFNPQARPYDQQASPVEVGLVAELSNPHSRAKKQARWKARQVYKEELLKTYVKAELSDLKGRTLRDARAEATWKWKQALVEEEKAEKRRKWLTSGRVARVVRKKSRRERKARKADERLRDLVLEAAPNQVIPSEQPLA
ncbi:hypothetical protein OF83DRAFT_1058118 [Amylostereum chailletii]|nr:hypothetical protein OF83DRAFT_1058118 [Amylostereum chailletii]